MRKAKINKLLNPAKTRLKNVLIKIFLLSEKQKQWLEQGRKNKNKMREIQ